MNTRSETKAQKRSLDLRREQCDGLCIVEKNALRHSQKSPGIKLLMAPFIVLFSSNDCGCCQNSQGTVGRAMQNVWLTREAVFSAPEAVLNQLLYGPVRPFKMHSGEIISGAGQGWILSFFFF